MLGVEALKPTPALPASRNCMRERMATVSEVENSIRAGLTTSAAFTIHTSVGPEPGMSHFVSFVHVKGTIPRPDVQRLATHLKGEIAGDLAFNKGKQIWIVIAGQHAGYPVRVIIEYDAVAPE